MRSNDEKSRKPYSSEHYAVALKYDYKFERSKPVFDMLISEKRLSDIGKIESAWALMKSHNNDKSFYIPSSISDAPFTDNRHQKMKIIPELLKELH